MASKIEELQHKIRIIKDYSPPFLKNDSSVTTLKEKTLNHLTAQVEEYKKLAQLANNPESTHAQSINLDNFNNAIKSKSASGVSTNRKTGDVSKAKRHVREMYLANRNEFVYVRDDFFSENRKNRWNGNKRSITAKMRALLVASNISEFKRELLNDIKAGITKDIQNPSIEKNGHYGKPMGGMRKSGKQPIMF